MWCEYTRLTTVISSSSNKKTQKASIHSGCRSGFQSSVPVRLGELGDLDRLIRGDVAEDLGRPARRPVDFEQGHPLRLARPMVCCKRASAVTAPRRNVPVDRQRLLAGRDHLDPGADGRAIGLLAHQLHGQPVVPLAGVLKEEVVVPVSVDGAAGLDEEIDIAVTVPVAARDRRGPFAGARCPRCR